MTASTRWPRIDPAAYRATTHEDELRREANLQVDRHPMASLQVAEAARATLSRWRHGFKSRWDYFEQQERSGSRSSHPAGFRRWQPRPRSVGLVPPPGRLEHLGTPSHLAPFRSGRSRLNPRRRHTVTVLGYTPAAMSSTTAPFSRSSASVIGTPSRHPTPRVGRSSLGARARTGGRSVARSSSGRCARPSWRPRMV